MSRRWLCLRFAAPLMSFGGVAVDHIGPTLRWPGRSMITGLIGNALGWNWTERAGHQSLQERLITAAALLSEGEIITDVQNAQLSKNDIGWTTRGYTEGRAGDSYGSPHRRRRDYVADADIAVVLTLEPSEKEPSLDDVCNALIRPARPLFLGRKPCLPSCPLVAHGEPFINASTAHEALRMTIDKSGVRAWWPESEGPNGVRVQEVADLRNWDSGLHGDTRFVHEGEL